MDRKSLIYQFDDTLVDLQAFKVTKAYSPIQLEPKAVEVLVYLVENRERLIEKKELLDAVWKDAFVTENAMTRVIAQLRKALGDDSKHAKYIETVPTRGYRFIAEVEVTKREEAGELDVDQSKNTHRGKLTSRRAVIIAACAMLVALIVALSYSWISNKARRSGDATPIRSMAVLPFKALVADNRDESLEMGIADTLITKLSTVKQIIVRPTSAVIKYAGAGQDLVVAGRELKVDLVLDGHIQRSGDKIRLTVQLVSMPDGAPLWSEKFDSKFTDIFTLQDLISEKVVGALRLKLTGEEQSRLTKRYTQSAEAYQLYLKGRFYWNKRTAEAFRKSIECFNQAIERDPNYALAYAGLADVYVLPYVLRDLPQDSYLKAKAAAKKALEIDETLAEAHTPLAEVLFRYDWNFRESDREFQRAIELNPNYATAHQWYGEFLTAIGRFDEGIAEGKRALELDPLLLMASYDLGTSYYCARQYDKTIEESRKALELDQSFSHVHANLGSAYEMKGSFQEAIAEFQKARQLGDHPLYAALLGRAFAVSGRREKALRMLDELKEIAKQRYDDPLAFAILYAALGEKDQAFQWLERGYQDHALVMTDLKVDPRYDNLRSDPRFADLLRRVGFPP